MGTFLEPVYLNEQMVLNCSAYLFKGVALETEETTTNEGDLNAELQIGVPFLRTLLSPINVNAGGRRKSSAQSRSARQYTMGGLHMVAVDELRKRRGMMFTGSIDQVTELLKSSESYVDVEAILKPTDYFGLIGTIKTVAPLAVQIFSDFGEQIVSKFSGRSSQDEEQQEEFIGTKSKPRFEDQRAAALLYQKAIMSVLESLESDYLTSNQLEMVMWTKKTKKPLGVVILDVTGYETDALKARLTGGEFRIIGKIIRRVGQAETMNLMERTILSQALGLIESILNLNESNDALTKYRAAIEPLRQQLSRILLFEIPGPAVRIEAMSICI